MKYIFTFLAFVLMSSGLAQLPDYVPSDGLVAWYPLDGFASDAGTYQLDGALEGPAVAEDRHGNPYGALSFDGVDDRVSIPHSDLTNPSVLTLSVWFKDSDFSNSDGQQSQLISKREFTGWGNAYEFGIGYPINAFPETPTIYSNFSVNGNHTIFHASDSIVENQWHQAVYSHGDDSLFIYLDGERVLAQTSPGPLPTNNELPTWFGGRPGDNGRNFYSGLLDDIGIWNRVLSDAEVLALYLASTSISGCTDLWACNYNPEATDDDDSCEYLSCVGCLNSLACNYDSYATLAGSCDFPDEGCEECVDGVVIAIDTDNDGVADCDELDGCTDPAACNYDPTATNDDGSCLYLPEASLASSAGVSPEGLLTVDVPAGLDTWHWSDGSVAASRVIVPFQEYVLTGSVGVAPEVGQVTEEGIVFHVDEDEQWALLASPSSIGSGVEWGCKFVTTGAVGSALGDGASNTAMILEVCDDPMAAVRVASEYGDGWFLPSMDELGAIYEHVHAAGLGEFFVDNTNNWFWSSTECATDGTAAGDIWFQNGDAFACNNKDSNPGGVIAAKRLDYAQCTYTDTLYVALGATPPVCGPGTVWDEASHSCIVAYPSDTDFDGCVGMIDLLDLLSVFGTCAESESEEVEWSCGESLEYRGYDYATVQIGEQCWFAENLRSENYENGDAILGDLNSEEWAETTLGASSVYDNDDSFTSIYGLHYNGYAVFDERGLCPAGWKISSWEEFYVLADHVGGQEVGCIPLKATSGWTTSPVDLNGTDEYGFAGLPSGYRSASGEYSVVHSGYWSSSVQGTSGVWNWGLGEHEYIYIGYGSMNAGLSVRCLQDSE